ncbi:MAG: class I SAM-dependent methyltransferase [Candidatus Heimdallarchaeota archaeon]
MNQKDNDTKQPSSLAKVYDVIAESFDSTRKYPWKEVSEFVEKVSQNDFVLDLGSGNGRHTKLLAQQSRGTIGIDISYNILKLSLAKELDGIIRDLNLINSDAVKLPFKDNAFDKMISIAVIHHLETEASRKNVLSEIFRILKKDGLAQISCWLKSHPRFSKDDLRDAVQAGKKDIIVPWTLKNGEKISRYYYLFDIDEIETLARSVGFSIIESKESNHNLFLTIKK